MVFLYYIPYIAFKELKDNGTQKDHQMGTHSPQGKSTPTPHIPFEVKCRHHRAAEALEIFQSIMREGCSEGYRDGAFA